MFGLRGVRGAPALAEYLDGPPEGGPWAMWIGGVVFAVLVTIPGIPVIVTSSIARSVFFISFGLVLHFHYFWGLHPKLCPFSGITKNVAALGMIGPILYALYYFIVLG